MQLHLLTLILREAEKAWTILFAPKLCGGRQIIPEAIVVVNHGHVVKGAFLLRLFVEEFLLENVMIRIKKVDDLDKPITIRQLLHDYLSQGKEGLDLLGGEIAILHFQIDASAKDLS